MATSSAPETKAAPKSAPIRKLAAAGKAPVAPKSVSRPRSEASATASPEAREQMIQDAAYYLAERHGFQGDPVQEWVEAEAEVDRQLQQS